MVQETTRSARGADGGTLGIDALIAWLRGCREILAANADTLNELDGAIGDADHGTNMTRGFDAVARALDGAPTTTVDALMRTVGTTLVSSVGGAAGPLYGTFFLRFGTSQAGATELTADTLLSALQAGVHGIEERGRSAIGQKTMLDAWVPALDAYQRASDRLATAILAGAEAAAQGRDATVDMRATKGRASYLGERSVGHMDPGAASTALIWRAAADILPGDARVSAADARPDAARDGDDIEGFGIAQDEAGLS